MTVATQPVSDKAARANGSAILRRSYPTKFEIRGKSGSMVELTGYASVYEAGYEMWDWLGSYTEVVRAGAGKKTLSENPQVQLLLNHEGLSMAYTKSQTLRLSEDSTGLALAADVNIERSDIRNMVTAIEDGNVDEMSFAFRVVRQQWSPDYDQRDILEYNIHRGDVSVVNFGANPETSVDAALRAQDFDRLSEQDARALFERLARRLSPPAAPTPQRSLALALALAEVQG
jgi:Escherichia/Staphylococcus phage prohead protease